MSDSCVFPCLSGTGSFVFVRACRLSPLLSRASLLSKVSSVHVERIGVAQACACEHVRYWTNMGTGRAAGQLERADARHTCECAGAGQTWVFAGTVHRWEPPGDRHSSQHTRTRTFTRMEIPFVRQLRVPMFVRYLLVRVCPVPCPSPCLSGTLRAPIQRVAV